MSSGGLFFVPDENRARSCRRPYGRLVLAASLQPLDMRPSDGTPLPLQGDEGVELGSEELGHIGRDRLGGEGGAFHGQHLGAAMCQKSVSADQCGYRP